jgi:hypothetical protein
MKKQFRSFYFIGLLVVIVIAIFACAPSKHIASLKGNYFQGYLVDTTNLKRDIVWENVIDVFMKDKYDIKVIDKASGFITSQPIDLTRYYTFEADSGIVQDSSKFVVIPQGKTIEIESTKFEPIVNGIGAEISIRVRDLGTKTVVYIGLLNLEAVGQATYEHELRAMPCRSTGVFEEHLMKAVLNE